MSDFFQPVKLTDSVYWVGAIDWGIRDFHGYSVTKGTTYNAYLIIADTVTLVDTVKKEHVHEMMSRIQKLVDPSQIDCIISNHSELDHSGGLPEVAGFVKPARILASKMGVRTLRSHFPDVDLNLEEVKTGDTLNLGHLTLRFIETKMLHWPDSMFTYIPEEKILFSQDAFGLHLASAERFADLISPTVVYREMAKYFANILMPYAHLIIQLMKNISEMGLEIDFIANDHGPIFRRDINNVFDWYNNWAQQSPDNRAIIIYDSMWGSTQKMAKVIAEGVQSGGGKPTLLPLSGVHRSDVALELLEAGALIAGSPTLNNNVFPTLADVMSYLKGLRRKNLVGAVFGSFGWSGEAVELLKSALEEMNVELIGEHKTQYVPSVKSLNACFEMGVAIGKRLSENRP